MAGESVRKLFRSYWNKIKTSNTILGSLSIEYLPRSLVFFIDLFLCFFSAICTFWLIARLEGREVNIYGNEKIILFFLIVSGLQILISKTYAGIIRHSTFIDLGKIIVAGLSSGLFLVVLNFFASILFNTKLYTNGSVAIYILLSLCLMSALRIAVKSLYKLLVEIKNDSIKQKVLIAGTAPPSISLATAIMENAAMPFKVVGFVSKLNSSKNYRILGKPIYDFAEVAAIDPLSMNFNGIIIIKETMNKTELEEWVNLSFEKGLRIFKSPNVSKFRINAKEPNINALQIEDLLQRSVIEIDHDGLENAIQDRNILITGGAGSIGSEIVRQVAKFKPNHIFLLDQAESDIFNLQQELEIFFPKQSISYVLADVSDATRMHSFFDTNKIDIIYHAAAYKHVPMIEQNPSEAVRVNIGGTKILADLSILFNVKTFVMISTDKAVNPTNVMGASKRVAELYVQSLQQKAGNAVKFITTRFGNVLGSNGSVIPLFKNQISKGGPVTVTHPDITRYFMTIPEASELVLEASLMGKGGEIFVFDMGKPVRIVDLARRMIKLSGHEPDIDIKITFTGLRNGEKLYEELLSDNAKTLPTHHKKILISMDPVVEYAVINEQILRLLEVIQKDELEAVKLIKTLVPEFKSNNSRFEALDVI